MRRRVACWGLRWRLLVWMDREVYWGMALALALHSIYVKFSSIEGVICVRHGISAIGISWLKHPDQVIPSS